MPGMGTGPVTFIPPFAMFMFECFIYLLALLSMVFPVCVDLQGIRGFPGETGPGGPPV